MAAEAVALAEKQVAELKVALAQNHNQIRNCQQQARRQALAVRNGGLSVQAVRKVLAVYVVSNWDLSLAVLAAQRLSRLPPCSAAFPTSDFVSALFREHNWEELLMLHDDASPLWAPARKYARQLLLEHDAYLWVKRLNFAHGVAPSASSVFHYYEKKALDAEPCGEPRKRTVNKWAARWRARWGVRRACLRSADTVEPNILRDKVKAFWRSIAYVTAKFSHQELVWINFDETSAVLPHFLVCSEARLPKSVASGFAALPQTKLRLLRAKSSWVTADSMISILADVRKALAPWLPMVKPILVLDTASPHLPKKVMSFAKKQGLQLLFVPSCSTSLLQPLDIAAFGGFKQWVKRKNMVLRQTAVDGQPELLEFLWQLSQAPRDFFGGKKWAHAFEGVGCGRDVTKLHSALKKFMQHPESFPHSAKPSPAEMALIWPKRRKMSYAGACLF
ncbi:DDE-1 domain-containing protein [Durusdinium trenchii]|uniref:DDE-1 domain-containing protein n=1 Tax=Durusdinium trenchii TaxID=1381693 RepID=A0ABP0LWI1_9DINO